MENSVYKVSVDLAELSYDIFIDSGLEDKIHEVLQQYSLSKKVMLLTDTHVASQYGDKACALLEKAGLDVTYLIVDAGESSKSFTVAEVLYTKVIEAGLDRKSPIFALGGGVIGDLTGFIAATYLRGVPFFQIPTSLLAQVDSSVGGKVAINHPLGKNLIGAFYQPKAVFIDLNVLKTLPKREIYTGLAEIIKYGVIYDAELFSYLENHVDEILTLDKKVLQHIIARSCEIKADVVSKDEKEMSLRIILNFGHTIAHAIENVTEYKVYNHGEAVAIGMHGALLISQKLGLIDDEVITRIKDLIQRFHLPLYTKHCLPEQLFGILFRDKKVVNGKIKWVLTDKIGNAIICSDIEDKIIRNVLQVIAD